MHLLVVADLLEKQSHLIFKFFIHRLIILSSLYAVDGFIDCAHDEVVVLSVLAVLENYI